MHSNPFNEFLGLRMILLQDFVKILQDRAKQCMVLQNLFSKISQVLSVNQPI